MAKAAGTAYDSLAKEIITQATRTVPYTDGQEQENLESITAALMEVAPRDPLEAMLVVQLITTHRLAMCRLAGIKAECQSSVGADMRINQAIKLEKLFSRQLEALQKYRTCGQPQCIRIERVSISGGQSIVGSNVQKG